jgi:type II secretory pathway component PulF
VNRAVRTVVLILVAAAVIVVLFGFVFPWFDRTFISDPTLGSMRAGASA